MVHSASGKILASAHAESAAQTKDKSKEKPAEAEGTIVYRALIKLCLSTPLARCEWKRGPWFGPRATTKWNVFQKYNLFVTVPARKAIKLLFPRMFSTEASVKLHVGGFAYGERSRTVSTGTGMCIFGRFRPSAVTIVHRLQSRPHCQRNGEWKWWVEKLFIIVPAVLWSLLPVRSVAARLLCVERVSDLNTVQGNTFGEPVLFWRGWV